MSQEVPAVTKSFKDWISEGESLYNAALKEYQSIEQQLDDLEAKLAAKKAEVNQIAQVIGKPPVETNRRLTAQLVEEHGPNSTVLGVAEDRGEPDPIIAGAKILVADDEPNIRTTISDILRKYRATVTVCENGGDAIREIENGSFNLVVSDIKMPDKTGYDVFAAARKKSQTVPVILMTGFGYDPNHCIVRASQEGLQAVLFKPFKVDQFLAEVRKALQATASR
jgi:CheY-like chemotaxis protein